MEVYSMKPFSIECAETSQRQRRSCLQIILADEMVDAVESDQAYHDEVDGNTAAARSGSRCRRQERRSAQMRLAVRTISNLPKLMEFAKSDASHSC
jgi:hypothetical protein